MGGVKLTRIELIVAGVTLFIFTEAFLSKMISPPVDLAAPPTADGDPLLRYLWLPFYGVISVGLLMAGWRSLKALAVSPLLVSRMLMAAASCFW